MKHMENLYTPTTNKAQKPSEMADQLAQTKPVPTAKKYYPPVSYDDEINKGWSEF